jgi:two-component system, OmpR family, alkaline phosphatase synthesis response regulator PhoP
MTSKSIWVVEDDKDTQSFYNDILGNQYRLSIFDDLTSFKQGISQQTLPDLLIADLHLPDGSFLNFYIENGDSAIRSLPFMVVSVLDDVDALRTCFKEKARDYISKPFPKSELIAKVERIFEMRKVEKPMSHQQVELDPTSLTLVSNGKHSKELTAKEYKILAIMLSANDKKISRQQIQHHIWQEAKISRKSLDQHLLHLRRKLSPVGLEIVYSAPYYGLRIADKKKH